MYAGSWGSDPHAAGELVALPPHALVWRNCGSGSPGRTAGYMSRLCLCYVCVQSNYPSVATLFVHTTTTLSRLLTPETMSIPKVGGTEPMHPSSPCGTRTVQTLRRRNIQMASELRVNSRMCIWGSRFHRTTFSGSFAPTIPKICHHNEEFRRNRNLKYELNG
jgi:hypothetical protein